jgi:glutathione S-transferase
LTILLRWHADSREICRYLCSHFPEDGNKTLYGMGWLERASIEQWLQAETQSFDGPGSELVFQLAFAPHLKGVYPDERKIQENEKKIQSMLGVYDDILSKNAYLAGDEFTLADLSHLPNSHYIVSSSERGRKLFTSKKHVARWYEDISCRESWKQVMKMQREHPGTLE